MMTRKYSLSLILILLTFSITPVLGKLTVSGDLKIVFNYEKGKGHFLKDLNNDRINEIAVWNTEENTLYVFSGKDGSILWKSKYGEPIGSIGDVNNDGFNDVICYENHWNGIRLYILNGLNGKVIKKTNLDLSNLHLSHIHTIHDLNGDGVSDIVIFLGNIISAPNWKSEIIVVSGRDLSILWKKEFNGRFIKMFMRHV